MVRARTFVLHIYRKSVASGELRGVVEPLRGDGKLTFRSFGELRDILSMPDAALRRRASQSLGRPPRSSGLGKTISEPQTDQEGDK